MPLSPLPVKILSSEQVRQADAYTVEHEPVSSIDLMERAATKCSEWILEHSGRDPEYYIFCGTGNNGADGLVITRLLKQNDCRARTFIIRHTDKSSTDFKANELRLKRIHGDEVKDVFSEDQLPELPGNCIVIDALFGTGLSRSPEGLAASAIRKVNNSRARVIAIDMPSGLFADTHTDKDTEVVHARHTLSFQNPKLAFMMPENAERVGEWEILDIGLSARFIEQIKTSCLYLTDTFINSLLKPRKKFSHKGTYGHALLISGKYGSMGAAVLAARACLRSGAGLLTVHLPSKGVDIMQISAPEAMVSADVSEHAISRIPDVSKYAAIGIGPGIGTGADTEKALADLLERNDRPMVLDADALNILGNNKRLLEMARGSIMTPHPGEFERLVQASADSFERLASQLEFSRRHGVYVVLKGAHSCLSTPDGYAYFNNTGNPGMAKGGSGDVLTGLITGLLAQGYEPLHAAMIGMHIHGRAGDLARDHKGETAMTPGDIIEHLPKAFR